MSKEQLRELRLTLVTQLGAAAAFHIHRLPSAHSARGTKDDFMSPKLNSGLSLSLFNSYQLHCLVAHDTLELIKNAGYIDFRDMAPNTNIVKLSLPRSLFDTDLYKVRYGTSRFYAIYI